MRRTRAITVAFAVAGAAGVAAVVGYVYFSRSASPLEAPSPSVATDRQSVALADSNVSSFDEPVPLGSLFGQNSAAPRPMVFPVGRSGDEGEGPDLSTPASAVYGVLCLIDEGATDELASCFVEETEEPVSNLYPRHLGHPIRLVEVSEEGESVKVVWEATVHTGFSRGGSHWSPGETITLTARLAQVEGLWKLSKLHDGDDDGHQKHDTAGN